MSLAIIIVQFSYREIPILSHSVTAMKYKSVKNTSRNYEAECSFKRYLYHSVIETFRPLDRCRVLLVRVSVYPYRYDNFHLQR